jgi:hypothetical protein
MDTITVTPLQQALEIIDGLSLDEQELLIEITQRRLIEQRRNEIAVNAKATLQAFQEGRASYGTVEDLRREFER